MIREALLANMHRAIDEGDFDQIARAKKILDEIAGDPTFKDYPGETVTSDKMDLTDLNLSPKRIQILELALQAQPKPVSYETLKQTLWPSLPNSQAEGTMRKSISDLNKILKHNQPPYQLENIRGIGYRLIRL